MIGGYFLNWWTFPLDIIEVTLFHHTPNDPGISNRKIVALMCIASQIEMNEHLEQNENYLYAMDLLGIDEEFIKEITLKYHPVS